MSHPADTATAKRETWLSYGLLMFAALTRLIQYLHNRSLWLDEASLALNLKERDFAGMFRPLSYDQGAPVPFMVASKFMYEVFGNSELVLRFIPLLLGLLGVFLLWRLALRIHAPAAPIVLLFVATNPNLIYYASEFKQYTGDVAIAVALLLLLTHVLDNPTRRSLLTAGVAGMIAVWFSHPALFVLAGGGLTLLVCALLTKRIALPAVLLLGAGWLVSFGLAYVLVYQSLAASENMQFYWDGAFFELNIAWVIHAFLELLFNIGGDIRRPALLVFVFGLGLVAGLRRVRPMYSLLLTAPILFTLIASLMLMYPFSGRLILFLTPGITIIIAAGLRHVLDVAWQTARPIGVVLGVLLVAAFALHDSYIQDHMEVRDTIAYLESREPDARFYVDPFFEIVGKYYDFTAERDVALLEIDQIERPIWVVGTGGVSPTVFEHLDAIARETDVFTLSGVSAHRYAPR